MRFNRFLLTTCAAICLALPTVSLADPPPGQDHRGDQQGHKPEKGDQAPGGGPQGGHAGQAGRQPGQGGRPSGPAVVQGGQGERRAPQGGRADRRAAPEGKAAHGGGGSPAAGGQDLQGLKGRQEGGRPPHGTQGQAQGQGPSGSAQGVFQGRGPNAPPAAHRGPVGPGAQASRAPAVRQPPALTGWNGNVRGPQRAQLGQQWRGQHRNWDQQAPWRGNRDWWRGDPSFRLFTGARIGFFFFPGYGYIAPPHQYRDHHWQAGDYLPRWFWRYSVKHYASYGLPRPPVGCTWIWLNGNVALVDRSDGYILDIVYNVW